MYFSPAHVMPLLEIVRTKEVAAQAIVDSLAIAAALRKTPIVVGTALVHAYAHTLSLSVCVYVFVSALVV
jgi:3-hydroxyacyl-CoA dehydrogenase